MPPGSLNGPVKLTIARTSELSHRRTLLLSHYKTTTPVRQNQRDTMILPSDHNDSPFDFNHMAAGNDKSDELGVPYYQQHDL